MWKDGEYQPAKNVEREKLSKRKELKPTTEKVTDLQIAKKLAPVLVRMLNSAKGQLKQQIKRYNDNDNVEKVAELSRTARLIQDMLVRLDTSQNVDWSYLSYNDPLKTYSSVISSGVQSLTGNMTDEQRAQYRYNLVNGPTSSLMPLLDFVRNKLLDLRQ